MGPLEERAVTARRRACKHTGVRHGIIVTQRVRG